MKHSSQWLYGTQKPTNHLYNESEGSGGRLNGRNFVHNRHVCSIMSTNKSEKVQSPKRLVAIVHWFHTLDGGGRVEVRIIE